MTPSPELTSRIVQLIRQGNFPHVAAGACGVPKPTFKRWIDFGTNGRNGRAPEEPFASFATAVYQARCEAECYLVSRNQEFARGSYLKKAPDGTMKKMVSKITPQQNAAYQWLLTKGFSKWGTQAAYDAEEYEPRGGEEHSPKIRIIVGDDPDLMPPHVPDVATDEYGNPRRDIALPEGDDDDA